MSRCRLIFPMTGIPVEDLEGTLFTMISISYVWLIADLHMYLHDFTHFRWSFSNKQKQALPQPDGSTSPATPERADAAHSAPLLWWQVVQWMTLEHLKVYQVTVDSWQPGSLEFTPFLFSCLKWWVKISFGSRFTPVFQLFGVRIQVEHAEASDCCLALTAATKAALGLKRPTTRIVGDLPKNHGIPTDFGSVTPKKKLGHPRLSASFWRLLCNFTMVRAAFRLILADIHPRISKPTQENVISVSHTEPCPGIEALGNQIHGLWSRHMSKPEAATCLEIHQLLLSNQEVCPLFPITADLVRCCSSQLAQAEECLLQKVAVDP